MNLKSNLKSALAGRVTRSYKRITYTHTRRATGSNKHLAAPSDRRSIVAVRVALSLAQLHSLIIHPLICRDVDKAFKQLNPCCINMSKRAHTSCINS